MKNSIQLLMIIGLSVGLLFGCKSDNKTTKSSKPVATKAKAPVGNKNAVALEGIPKEIMQKLWNEADYTDYIFQDLPFSISQNAQSSIRLNLNYISQEVNEFIPLGCKPLGRQMYHIKGEIVVELDVYLSDGCTFYVFIENAKPKYSNKMSEQGLAFFKNTLKQASDARQQMAPQ